MHAINNITIPPEILKLLADIDELKAAGKSSKPFPERLTSLRRGWCRA
jgi:hypothetical protein